jgi:hypothetical protein
LSQNGSFSPNFTSEVLKNNLIDPRVTRDRCYDFKNIFAEKNCEKIGVFDAKQSLIMQIFLSLHWIWRKAPIFSPKIGKNRRKL